MESKLMKYLADNEVYPTFQHCSHCKGMGRIIENIEPGFARISHMVIEEFRSILQANGYVAVKVMDTPVCQTWVEIVKVGEPVSTVCDFPATRECRQCPLPMCVDCPRKSEAK